MNVRKARKTAPAAFAQRRMGIEVRVAAICMGMAIAQAGWAQAQSQPAAAADAPSVNPARPRATVSRHHRGHLS